MREIIQQVDQFLHQAGNLTVPDQPGEPPRKQINLVFRLLLEEVEETVLAAVDDDRRKMVVHAFSALRQKVLYSLACSTALDFKKYLDGLGDTRFVAAGGVRNCGVSPELLDLEICRSNSTKFGPGHTWNTEGKLIKSPDYSPPDIAGVIEDSRITLY